MKGSLPVRDLVDRISRAELEMKHAGDYAAANHFRYIVTLILRMADSEEESIEPEEE